MANIDALKTEVVDVLHKVDVALADIEVFDGFLPPSVRAVIVEAHTVLSAVEHFLA